MSKEKLEYRNKLDDKWKPNTNNKKLLYVGENLSRWQLGGLIDSHKLVTKK